LWLDPHLPQGHAVVSHAHSDHTRPHRHVVASAATAAMMRLRGGFLSRFQELPFGATIEHGEARVTLYPAGHILGSAQVLVEWQDTRLLYSGDFKLRPGLSCEVTQVPRADIVVMETTFGRPRYRFPATEIVKQEIVGFCHETLANGQVPVLFCYSLGKGQEVLALLDKVNFPIYLEKAHHDMARLYVRLGMPLPPFELYRPGHKVDGVLLCASGCRRHKWFSQLLGIRTAYISGWAADGGATRRFGTDAAFALSDHADYDDLLAYVRLTGAGTIYTVHGFAAQFAGDLRNRGLQARALEETPRAYRSRVKQAQLRLPI
jgi:DNA ligase-1